MKKKRERERKKKAWLVHDLGEGGDNGGGTIWASQSLAGWPPVLSLSLFESWKSFEGKIEMEMNLRLKRLILQSN